MFTVESVGLRTDAIAPEVILVIFGISVLILEVFLSKRRNDSLAYISLGAIVAAGWFLFLLKGEKFEAFAGHYMVDSFGLFFKMVILLGAAMTVLLSIYYNGKNSENSGEYYALILFAVVGQFLMISGNNLMTIFLGLETMSISLYILAGITREREAANEASIKYFILGSLSSGILLYGIALLFGATGSINLADIGEAIAAKDLPAAMVIASFILIFIGLAFKIAAVPFHMWAPDVYQGAPTPVTAFMSSTAKVAGFALLIRVLTESFSLLWDQYLIILYILSVITMTAGNLMALVQENVKRMLAYSSISHVGYILIAVLVATNSSISSAGFYLLAYTIMNIGAFAVVAIIANKQESNLAFEDFRGLGYKKPALGAILAIMLFSLAGIPPTVGFFGKFYIFMEAINHGYVCLVIIAALNSVLSVFYYLKLTVFLYLKEEVADSASLSLDRYKITPPMAILLIIALSGVLIIGIFPEIYLRFSQIIEIIG